MGRFTVSLLKVKKVIVKIVLWAWLENGSIVSAKFIPRKKINKQTFRILKFWNFTILSQFHQRTYVKLLCAQIPKAQKDSQVISRKKVDRLVKLLYFGRFALYAVHLSLIKLTPALSLRPPLTLSLSLSLSLFVFTISSVSVFLVLFICIFL